MKRDVVKVDAVASCKCGCVCHASSRACSDATSSDLRSTTPAPPKMRECDEAVTPPRSAGSRRDLNSSCKRRRLASDDENIDDKSTDGLGAVRKLIYEKNDSDSSDDFDDEDLWEKEKMEFLQERILMQMKRVNCEYDEDQLLHTASSAKLFEFVTWCDVVEGKWYDGVDKEWVTCAIEERGDVKGQWVCRGVGCCKFIKCLEEGYNCGMIRLELTKNGTLETLMRHELTNEEVRAYKDQGFIHVVCICEFFRSHCDLVISYHCL